jgi:DNA-binding MarR family transcriptional regulator
MQVMRQLVRVGTRAETLIADLARVHGLSHAALNALAVIEAAGGPVPTGVVTAQMHITTATMTSVLDTLERRGYVRREPDPADRRRVLVDITPQAQAQLDELLPRVQQVVTATLTPLGEPTLRRLLYMLTRTGDALDDVPADLPPPPRRRAPRELRRS